MNERNGKSEIYDYSSAERLFRDIGCIHADLIEEALGPKNHYNPDAVVLKNTKKKWILSVGALAACLIIFIGTGLMDNMKQLEVIQIDSRWNTSEGAVGGPDWAKSADELYRDVPYDENISLESMPVFKRKYYADRDTLQYVSFDLDAMKNQLEK